MDVGGVQIVEVRRGGPVVDTVYAEVLRPSFPPDELVSLATLRAGITAERMSVMVALDGARQPVGAAVGDWSAAGRVMMLAHLAARPGGRGRGVGGALLKEAVRAWSQRYQPCLVLAEVERPDRYRASIEHGDPVARLRFYQRHGALALSLPYFQPALSAATGRAYGMLLVALDVPDEYLVGPEELTAEPLRLFWEGYLAAAEGGVPDDPAAGNMAAALRSGTGVPLRRLDEYRRIPVAD